MLDWRLCLYMDVLLAIRSNDRENLKFLTYSIELSIYSSVLRHGKNVP
jgi:hypothetical protein